MPNMSYCRFENTSGDLSDCVDAFQEMELNAEGKWGQWIYDSDGRYWEECSEYEQPCIERLALLAKQFVDLYEAVIGEPV